MKRFLTYLFLLIYLNQTSYTQCTALIPISLPFIEDFESYSDTLNNNDTLFCSSSFLWTFNASSPNGRAMCGTGSPVNNGGNGGVTFDVNDFNIFSTNELILTLNLSNYNLSDPLYLSFDCNNIADEPNIEDRVYIRGNNVSPWIEIYNWSLLPPNQWKSERENISIATTLANNSQNTSSTFQVKFSQRDNYGYSSDGFAIDNIAIELISCPKAQNFILDYQNEDSAILSWGNSINNNWNIEYGLKGFSLGQGTSIQVSGSKDTITQLSNNSIYEFYIQSNCGNNGLSSWEGPLSLYTTIKNDSSCDAIFIEPNGNLINTHNYNTDVQFSESFVLNNSPRNTIWFKTVVPNSGHLAIETCSSSINTEIGTYYNPTSCSDLTTFNQIAIASFSTPSTQNICSAPGKAAVELCSLPPGDTILFWIGSYSNAIEGEIYFSVYDYSVEGFAGNSLSDTLSLCSSDTTNLFENIENYDTTIDNWNWNYNTNTNAIIQDSLLINGLTTYNFSFVNYIVSNICSSDISTFMINISSSNFAGTPISNLEYCNTSPIYLFSGISGLVETSGTWYSSDQNPLVNPIFNPTETDFGTYEFSYIVDENSCKADTSFLSIELLNCTNIEESDFEKTLIYPNPNKGKFFINTNESSIILITDITGKTIKKINYPTPSKNLAINIEEAPKGTYILNIITPNKTKRVKVIIQ